MRRLAGLALLACFATVVLGSLEPNTVGLGGGLGPIVPGLLGLAASGGTDRDTALEHLATELESYADRLEGRPSDGGGGSGSESDRGSEDEDEGEGKGEGDIESEGEPATRDGTAVEPAGREPDRERTRGRLREREPAPDRPVGDVGDLDVDDLLDRDDEVGRLAAAVDELAAAVRERERRLADHERYRRELYRIASAPEAGSEETLRRLLELGCERLEVDAGFVSRVDESGREEIRLAAGPGSGTGEGAGESRDAALVRDGDELEPSAMYRRETAATDGVFAVADTGAAGSADEGGPREREIGCYLSGTIEVDAEPYGRLCFVDREPRDEPFTGPETAFVELAVRCASRELERRERERRLERYRAFTDDILDAVDDIVYVLDADGDLLRWNKTLVEVTGYADADLEAMHATEFVDDSDRATVENALGDVFDRGTVRVDADLVTSDGERIPYEFVASALEDPDGEPVIAGIGRDSSERKQYERELERTTQLLEQAQQLSNMGAWELDVRGEDREIRWTDEIARIHGVSPDADVALEEAIEFYHPDDRPRIRRAVERAIEAGESYDLELRLVTAENETRWVRTIGEPVRKNGATVAVRGSLQEITERKERERELQETTERLEAIIEASPAAIIAFDVDGTVQQWNTAAEEIFGWSEAEAVGNRPLFVPEERTDEFEAFRERLLAGESLTGVETERKTKAGERIDVSLSAAPMRNADGEIVGVMGALEDITERKERERELQETNETLGAIIEASPAALIALDQEGRVTLWNPAAEEIFGWSEEEVMGEPLPTVPDDRETDHGRLRDDVLEGETYARVETKRQRKDGEVIDVSLSKAPMRNADGEVIGVMGALEDITERKERERELQETNETLGAIIEASPAALIALDDNDRVTLWNPAAERIFGWSEEEVMGEPLPILPDDRTEEHRDIFEDLLEGERYAGVETKRRRKDGEVIDVSLSAAPVRNADGEIVGSMGALEDITDRKERERRLETTTARLEALFDNSPDIIDVLDSEGTIVEANQRFQSALGYDEDELVGTKIWEYEVEFDADEVVTLLSELSVGERRKFEGRFRRRDGSTFPIEVHLIRLGLEHDADENQFMAICRDITDRKERERDLRETKRRLELALEGSSTGIWEWNVGTDEISWNETLERMLGLEPGAFDGTYEDFSRRVHPDDIERIERALEDAVEGDEPYQAEFRMRHADGDWLWFVARGRLVDGSETAVESAEDRDEARMLGIVNDITQRKEHERQLRDRERQLQRYTAYTDDVLDAIDDVFYVLDEDYDFQRWNASLTAVTGYTDAELEGMNALEFIAEADRKSVRTGLDNIDELRGVPLEADVVTRDGERIPFEFVAAPLEDPEGNPVVAGIGRDISERVEKERQLSRLISNVPGLVYRAENEPGWPIEFISEGARDVTGYDPSLLERGEVVWSEDVERGEGTWGQIRAALERKEPFNRLYPIETADGERRWVKEQGRGVYADDGSVEAIEGVVIDITERIEYERELERTTDLLERVQRMAEVGGWELDMESEPRTATWSDELYRLHDLPRDVDPDLETTIECYHPDDRPFVRNQLETALADESGYELEARLQTDAGEIRWVRAMGEPIYDDDGTLVKYRGSVQNITDQKERERALELLNETARGLLESETEETVAELVVETAGELLESGGAAVYTLDAETNRFEPTASAGAERAGADDLPSVAVGDNESVLWNTYVAGTQTVVDSAAIDDGTTLFGDDDAGGLLVPIGDHGVFVVDASPAAIDDETRQLFETLVATTEAAFDRLESEANLRERDAELEARNRRLRRQIGINELIRRIDQSLIGAASRSEIERTVPERLVESDEIAFAWIGTVDSSGTTLEPRTWAGESGSGEYLDAVSLDLDPGDVDPPEPAVRTAVAEEPTLVENVVDRFQQEPWRTDALNAGFQSVVAVPLAFEEYTYGVLAVYADEPEAFTDLERTVLTELGESIANAINAVKTREALHAETFVELTLELPAGEDVLSRIATATGARVTYEGLGTASADQTVLFFEASGADSADVRATLEDLVAVTDYRCIRESEEESLFEATVAGDIVASRLVRHGGSPRSIAADGDRTTVTVDVPMGTDVREFVEMLGDHYADVELRSQRHVERETQTRQELVSTLFEALTDRQLEVLRTAYFAGFFEWPRESTGEEIAEMLGVTQPTVNRHLRIGQQRLLTQLFDDETLALGADS